MKPDLELATVDELIDELNRRFPALVFSGLKPAQGEAGNGEEEVLTYYRGGLTTAYGLAKRVAISVAKVMGQESAHRPGRGDDEAAAD